VRLRVSVSASHYCSWSDAHQTISILSYRSRIWGIAMAHSQRSGCNWTVGPANGKISTLEPPWPTIQSTPLQMVLSILIAAIIAPGLLGSQEAIRQSQSKEKKEEHRARRCNLIATCVKSSNRSREINGRQVVLRNGKLWIDTGTEDGSPLGHPYAGYYLPYPDTEHEGLVTTITDVAPIMNWVYIDKQTHEVRYGVRADAQPNFTGPFDCTRQDRRLTFGGWEGFCAVEQAPGLWGLYFDVDDDGLKEKVEPGMRVLEIEISRKEKRFQKEKDERMADQTTKREVDTKEEAPVDKPLGVEALVPKPGVTDASVGHVDEEGAPKPPPLRPLNIPKSIFDDPPPMVEPLVFRPPTPKTPPLAYSPPVQQVPAEPVYSEDIVEGPSTVPETTRYNNSPTPEEASPPDRIVTPPVQPQSPPTAEKRTTPKLNRSNGTRALAQAQKFEAMAAAQQPSAEVQRGTSKRGSRANSNTSSVYSNQDDALNEPTVGIRAQPSPTPAPLAIGVSKAKASAASGAVSGASVQRPVTPLRQRAPSAAKDPAIFGTKPTASTRAVPLSRRSSAPREPTTIRTSAPRSTSQSSTQRPSSTRRRELSASEQLSSSSSTTRAFQSPVRASPRANAGPARASLARTMTSGQGNQGMTNRMTDSGQRRGSQNSRPIVAQSRLRAPTAGRKTTSALFREIDGLVSQDAGGPSGNTGDSATAVEQKKK
jgi:hypothetical protein